MDAKQYKTKTVKNSQVLHVLCCIIENTPYVDGVYLTYSAAKADKERFKLLWPEREYFIDCGCIRLR